MWTDPELLPFSGSYVDGYIALHPDGSRMYFQSNRPAPESESAFEWNLWMVEREGDGWGEPRSMGRPINGRNHTSGLSVTTDGTPDFTIMEIGGISELYRSEFLDGAYQEPERLPDAVNAFDQQYDSYVAPDESFLIFNALEEGNPQCEGPPHLLPRPGGQLGRCQVDGIFHQRDGRDGLRHHHPGL